MLTATEVDVLSSSILRLLKRASRTALPVSYEGSHCPFSEAECVHRKNRRGTVFGVSELGGIELIDPGDFAQQDYHQSGWANVDIKCVRQEWEAFATRLNSAGVLVRKVSIGNHNPDRILPMTHSCSHQMAQSP